LKGWLAGTPILAKTFFNRASALAFILITLEP
jgi:hypothetical protein